MRDEWRVHELTGMHLQNLKCITRAGTIATGNKGSKSAFMQEFPPIQSIGSNRCSARYHLCIDWGIVYFSECSFFACFPVMQWAQRYT